MSYLYKDAREGRLAPYAVISHEEIAALQGLKRLASVQLYLQLLKDAAGRADGKWLGLKELLRALQTSKASMYRALADLQSAGLIRRLDNVPNQGTVIELVYPSQCLIGETSSLTGETDASLTDETIHYTCDTETPITTPLPPKGETQKRITKEVSKRQNEILLLAAHLVRNWNDSWNCEPDRRYSRIRHALDCFAIGIDGDSIKWAGTKRKRDIQDAIAAAVGIIRDNGGNVAPITGQCVDTGNRRVTDDLDALRGEYYANWDKLFSEHGYQFNPDSSERWRVHTIPLWNGRDAGISKWLAMPKERKMQVLTQKLEFEISENGPLDSWFKGGWK